MASKISTPIFLVGCPRSGTTLLQSLLAAHPKIASFPESKFFHFIVPEYEPRRQALGIASRRIKPALEKFFNNIGHTEMVQQFPKVGLIGQYTRKFIKILYLLTEEQGKSIWLEKTPNHIYYLEYIEKFVRGVKIIHLVRSGADVVASLYEVTHKYPKSWGGTPWDIDLCIERWIRAYKISLSYLNEPNHLIVRYEQLLENPQTVLEKLCEFIGVEWHETMLTDYSVVSEKLTLGQAGRTVIPVIPSANSQKFYRLFDAAQRQYILNRLSEFSLDKFNLKLN
ncbi:MAG: sulfotransferase [Symploca sp. SIO3E6]|nr:sulfotransferase [Caldora sp. SIO3E6]